MSGRSWSWKDLSLILVGVIKTTQDQSEIGLNRWTGKSIDWLNQYDDPGPKNEPSTGPCTITKVQSQRHLNSPYSLFLQGKTLTFH